MGGPPAGWAVLLGHAKPIRSEGKGGKIEAQCPATSDEKTRRGIAQHRGAITILTFTPKKNQPIWKNAG